MLFVNTQNIFRGSTISARAASTRWRFTAWRSGCQQLPHKPLAYHFKIFIWSHTTPLYFILTSNKIIEVPHIKMPRKERSRAERATVERAGANCRCRVAEPAPTTPPCHRCGKRATFSNTKTRPNNQLMFLNNLEHSLQRNEIYKKESWTLKIYFLHLTGTALSRYTHSIHYSFKNRLDIILCSLSCFYNIRYTLLK